MESRSLGEKINETERREGEKEKERGRREGGRDKEKEREGGREVVVEVDRVKNVMHVYL